MNEVVGTILFVTGIVLSVAFKIPLIKVWWDEKTKKFKTYATIGINVGVGAGILGAACLGVQGIEVPVACSSAGVGDVVIALGIIYGGNQAAYNVLKKKD